MKLLYAEMTCSIRKLLLLSTYHKYIVDAVYNGADASLRITVNDGIILEVISQKGMAWSPSEL